LRRKLRHVGEGVPTRRTMLCLPKTLSGMTRGWAYGNEAADGRISDPAAACYPVVVHEARLEAENLLLRQSW
jgi:hypothetical protein